MNLTLYLLRHGQTAPSRDDMFCGSGTDAPLTLDGQQTAREFAASYSATTWHEIFSSPLFRAQTTVQPPCKSLRLIPETRLVIPETRPILRKIDMGR